MTKATTRRDPEPPTEDDPAAERDLLVDDEAAEPRPYDDDMVQENGL